ncbi:MAG: hypothetical protein KDK07_12045 [Bauldia sp.]|nr:hypothetical protein [Bauldia sp.]
MKRTAAVIAVAIAMLVPAMAKTGGGFMTAGGIGMIQCAVFSNYVAEARAAGINTTNGIQRIDPFISYALGFYTGYNSVADDMWDILAGIRGEQMHISIITMMDGFCQANPTDEVDDALFDTIYKLLPTAQIEPPL